MKDHYRPCDSYDCRRASKRHGKLGIWKGGRQLAKHTERQTRHNGEDEGGMVVSRVEELRVHGERNRTRACKTRCRSMFKKQRKMHSRGEKTDAWSRVSIFELVTSQRSCFEDPRCSTITFNISRNAHSYLSTMSPESQLHIVAREPTDHQAWHASRSAVILNVLQQKLYSARNGEKSQG